MDSKPFSSPAPSDNSTSESIGVTEIKPPATVTVSSTPYNNDQTSQNPMLTSANPAVQTINVSQPGGGSNTVSNVFLIIGAVVFVIGLGLGGLGVLSFSDTLEKVDEIGAKKVSKIQPLLDDTIVFSSDGNTTNEFFLFDTDIWYNVRAAQGVTINSISILDENNNTLYFEEKCEDWYVEDGIDDCKDFTTFDIGNIDWGRYNEGPEQFINGTININATGEVTINNLDDDFWEDTFVISEQIDGEYFAGPAAMVGFGACVGCCIAPVGFLVGIIIRFA